MTDGRRFAVGEAVVDRDRQAHGEVVGVDPSRRTTPTFRRHPSTCSTETRPAAAGTRRHRRPTTPESRDGYVRTAFTHGNAGANPSYGCNTRAEVVLQEAVEQSEISAGSKLAGGRWFSLYDDTWVTSASGLDVDHLVSLAEAWDSNDLATPTSTARQPSHGRQTAQAPGCGCEELSRRWAAGCGGRPVCKDPSVHAYLRARRPSRPAPRGPHTTNW